MEFLRIFGKWDIAYLRFLWESWGVGYGKSDSLGIFGRGDCYEKFGNIEIRYFSFSGYQGIIILYIVAFFINCGNWKTAYCSFLF